ncbi:MAG: MFS transporter, partial [Pseudomonadales bacterium]
MRVSWGSSLSYGVGGAVYAVKEAAFTMFVLLFYTQILGLSGTATGIVLFLSLVWDAVSDPMMGTWSDRFHSRWGRRLPFMAVSAFPLGLGFVALFNPPAWALSDTTYLAGWLLACSLWIRTAVTVFALPHLALAAEMTQDYHERSRLLGMRIGFLFLASISLPALSMYFLFGKTNGEDGRFIAENYVNYGWASAIVVWLASMATIWGTRGFIDATKVAAEKMPSSEGLRGMARDFFGTFRNINFRNLLYYDLAASSSYGITVTLNVMAWAYYWELDATQMSLLMGLPVITAVPLALLTLGPLGKRWPKHKILNRAIIFMLLDAIWLYLLRIFDLIPANGHLVVLGLL